jgi:hypothetical protein
MARRDVAPVACSSAIGRIAALRCARWLPDRACSRWPVRSHKAARTAAGALKSAPDILERHGDMAVYLSVLVMLVWPR